jgi:hypothetical protein
MGAICPQNAPKFLGSGPRADPCGISLNLSLSAVIGFSSTWVNYILTAGFCKDRS